ncbi:hypothetical protein Snas_5253 [Stackebrandtia nassauensis DSM 44728]|uniref:Uncharacterized protein n=2 Tax=Stackebrandtia TaxID=283810 RepID=D3QBZ8_STANL|nr:hypothetical protein Snas_5253 [Stackebrandtia nassauensis DSM 44728]
MSNETELVNAQLSLRPNLRVMSTWHKPLMVNVTLMTALVLVSTVGLFLDDRVLLNESIWLKPLKFGFAFAVYSATLAWLLTKLKKAKRFGWWFGLMFAVFGITDVAVIALAASQGTFSHFAEGDSMVNQIVQTVFQYGVPPLLISNLVIGILVLVQRTGDRALSWALRAGLLLSTAGMAVAFALIPASYAGERTVTDANGDKVAMSVGHGIGDPDGTGMPLTNWSSTGGDLRVPHFIGLHGIHVLLLTVLVLAVLAARVAWLRDDRVRAGLVGAVAIGYTGLFAVTTWQAARGQSLIHPDSSTLLAMAGAVLVAAAVALVTVAAGRRRAGSAKELVTAV